MNRRNLFWRLASKVVYYILPKNLHRRWNFFLFRRCLQPYDVFIVGHPKSGNTWLSYALAILLYQDRGRKINLANLKQFVPTVHGNDARIALATTAKKPRLFRNEWPLYPDFYPKTIYLVRDPRAVLVSYYNHYRTVNPKKKITIAEFVSEYLHQGNIKDFEPDLIEWHRQVAEWLNRAKNQPVLIVSYEAMKDNLPEILKKVAHFAGLPASEDAIIYAAERVSFAAMQSDEDKFGAESYPSTSDQRFIRQGRVDSWKEELDQGSIRSIEHKYGELMKKLGYKLS